MVELLLVIIAFLLADLARAINKHREYTRAGLRGIEIALRREGTRRV